MAANNNTSIITSYYDYLFVELADPRANKLFLIKDPLPGLTILGLYLYFVNSWGPKFMENRKPFELKYTLMIYNFIQVLLSTYIFIEAALAGWLTTYSWKCEPVDFSNSPQAMRIVKDVHFYFLIKLTELLDTVFFILRKKNNQVTFLHKYHHTVMPMISWGCTKYYPGGHGTFIGFINSFVHIVMYTYYLLAAMGPRFQKMLWWKKYITVIQMVQFAMTFIHNSQLLFRDCGYPRWSVVFTLPNSVFFWYLFSDFYKKAYTSNKKNGEVKSGALKNGAITDKLLNGRRRNEKKSN